MRSLFVRCFLFVGILLSSFKLWASPQQSELLIIQNDTIRIYQILLPNEIVKSLYDIANSRSSESDFIKALASNLNNWRGYRGIWELAEDNLYLVGFEFGFNGLDLGQLFPTKIKDGRVLADWFNSTLIIPKGKVLRWDGIFSRTYVAEEHLTFNNGHLTSSKMVQNYVHLPNGIRRAQDSDESRKEIADVLFKSIVSVETDWNALEERYWNGVMGDYFITIVKNGRVISVEDLFNEHSPITRLFKRRLQGLQFDIIKFNGKPYEEVIRLWIDLNEDDNKLELDLY